MSENKQREWLERLQRTISKEIQIAYNYGDRPGSWFGLSTVTEFPVDYRTVLPNEIIFDIDSEKWHNVIDATEKIIIVLKENGIPYNLGWSGGRGTHSHTFFEIDDDLLRKINEIGMTFRDLRLGLWNWVSDQAKIGEKYRGKGKFLDDSCINWNDLAGGHLVREFGGSKVNVQGKIIGYKTLIKGDIPERRDKISFNEVEYPDAVLFWHVPRPLIDELISDFESKRTPEQLREWQRGTDAMRNYKGTYLNLPCIEKVKNGMQEGKRNLGAQILSIALRLDKFDKESANTMISKYYDACPKRNISLQELKGWINWIYSHPNPFWHCALPIQLGLCSKNICPLHQEKYRDVYEFLKSPNLMGRIENDITVIGVAGESVNKKMVYFAGTSRLLRNPLSLTLKGEPAGGKSTVANRTLELFPPEDVEFLTKATASALYYEENPDALKHKVLLIQERIGSEQSDYSIRSMQSERKIAITLPIKDPETGVFKRITKVVEGPVSVIETTTEPTIKDENATRSFELWVDESKEQTEAIFKVDNKQYLPHDDAEKQQIIERHRIAQKLLEPLPVMIPYINEIEFPLEPLRVRRDRPRFLALIEVSAFLHQYQRERIQANGKTWIVANLDDYKIAYNLSLDILRQTIKGIPPKSDTLYNIALGFKDDRTDEEKKEGKDKEFTRRDLEKATGWSRNTVVKYIEPLIDKGYFEIVEGGKGKEYKYKAVEKEDITEKINILTPEQLQEKIKEKDLTKLHQTDFGQVEKNGVLDSKEGIK